MDWEIIHSRLMHLIEGGRRTELRGALMMLNVVDIAQFMQSLDGQSMLMVFRMLPKDVSAEVFAYMEPEQQEQLIGLIGDSEIRALIDEMFLDDAVDTLEELPANVVKRVLANTSPETRALINQFLQYPDYTAGSIMTIEFAEFHSNYTVRQAMDSLRKTGLDKETIYTCYVIDEKRHLMGSVALRHLIMAEDDAPITEVMDSAVISVRTLDDQESVADTVRKYDLIAIPVVDNENRLVGIVTVDDAMDVIEEENTEDLEKMNALLPSEDEYLKTSVWRLAWNRLPWLLFLMITATLTGLIITYYEDVLLNAGAIGVALTACIPILMGTGGNAGSQASTLMIRGLALGEVELKDIPRILWREIRVGVMLGAVLGVVNFLRMIWLNGLDWVTALVVAGSLFLTVIMAKALGCTLPMFAKKINLDPALMASPMITTLVDAGSLAIMFGLASRFLLG
ncbi:MAG: magnesium transporter [Clostridia bacterium]|nr:magnesium transporter [Clostridia bacterium]